MSTSQASPATILIVDDEPLVLAALRPTLERERFHVIACSNPETALALLVEHDIAVIISDQKMPEMPGHVFSIESRRLRPNASRILLTAVVSLPTVVDAINKGEIFRFVAKPWLREELLATVRNAVQRNELIMGNDELQAETQQRRERPQIRILARLLCRRPRLGLVRPRSSTPHSKLGDDRSRGDRHIHIGLDHARRCRRTGRTRRLHPEALLFRLVGRLLRRRSCLGLDRGERAPANLHAANPPIYRSGSSPLDPPPVPAGSTRTANPAFARVGASVANRTFQSAKGGFRPGRDRRRGRSNCEIGNPAISATIHLIHGFAARQAR